MIQKDLDNPPTLDVSILCPVFPQVVDLSRVHPGGEDGAAGVEGVLEQQHHRAHDDAEDCQQVNMDLDNNTVGLGVIIRPRNQPSRRLKFHKHGEGHY